MHVLTHFVLLLLSASVIWGLSGILIDATDRVAKRYNKPGFAVAFIVLGFLTSIGEMSVAFSATLRGVPQVSAGNLLGASLVIFLLVIPLLAVLGNGIPMTQALSARSVAVLLGVVALPALLSMDGGVSRLDGVVMILLYTTLLYVLHNRRSPEHTAREALARTKRQLTRSTRATAMDIGKIVTGAVLIFVAGNVLVRESVEVAELLSIPVSFVGLLLLSIGTNIPELVIAVRAILGKHKDIAFGDYMGSAAANTLIYAFLPLFGGAFPIVRSEALLTLGILATGLVLFYIFSRSGRTITRREGSVLLGLYALFLVLQVGNAFRLSGDDAAIKSGPPLSSMPMQAKLP